MRNNKWTIYIKSIRSASEYSLRVAAKKLGVSPPYLHDVEIGKRAPTRKLVNSIIALYGLDDEAKRDIIEKIDESTLVNLTPREIRYAYDEHSSPFDRRGGSRRVISRVGAGRSRADRLAMVPRRGRLYRLHRKGRLRRQDLYR